MSIKNNFIFSLVFLISLFSVYAVCPNSMLGDGSVDNPCNITSWADLDAVRDDLTLNYQLVANLSKDTTGYAGIGDDWQPIANGCKGDLETICNSYTEEQCFEHNCDYDYDLSLCYAVASCSDLEYDEINYNYCLAEGCQADIFESKFNGNNKFISDLSITQEGYYTRYGLFGYLYGNVSNIKLNNITYNLIVNSYTGGLSGKTERSIINNCSIQGNIIGDIGTNFNVGGLIGININTIINNSNTNVYIISNGNIGGLIGNNIESYIYNSYSIGTINCTGGCGGLIGLNGNSILNKNGYIYNSYSLINLTGIGSGFSSYIGGLIGYNEAGGIINNSFSTGKIIKSITNTGGLIGYRNPTILFINSSYYDNQTSNQSDTGKGIGKTTSQMKNISIYVGWNISASAIDINNGYPYLAWQIGNTSATWLIYDSSLAPTPPSNTTTKNDQLIQAVSNFPALFALLITIIFVAFIVNILNGNIVINNLNNDAVLKAVFIIVLSAMMFGILILVYNYLPLS